MAKIIAVAGKGGVGKTTLTGLMIQYLCKNGKTPILAVDAPSIFWVRHISPAAQISRLTPLIRRTTFLAETPRHEFFFCGICSIPPYISRMGSLSPTGNFHPGNCTMTFFAEGASNGCSGSIRGGFRISRKRLSSWEEF